MRGPREKPKHTILGQKGASAEGAESVTEEGS